MTGQEKINKKQIYSLKILWNFFTPSDIENNNNLKEINT
jgi:hypothetical protein